MYSLHTVMVGSTVSIHAHASLPVEFVQARDQIRAVLFKAKNVEL